MVTLVETARVRAPAPERAWWARLWDLPVRAHLAALALVLLALVPFVGTSSSFSADEGAAIVQARSLSEGRGWIVEHPLPAADPEGVNYPLELSERGPDGRAPFGKHPLYALLLAGADRIGGVTAMVLLSLAGTVAAAGLASALARRLDPSLARTSVWVVGLASPLLFDGYLLIAHTLGAALAAAAVLAAVVAIERRSPVVALACVPAVGTCVLLRNEGILLAVALAAVGAVTAWRRADMRSAAAVVAGGAVLAGAGAHLLDRWWTGQLLGVAGDAVSGAASPATSGSSGLVAGRIQGLLVTWLTPSYSGDPVTGLALFTMLVALAFGAVTVRRQPADDRRVVGCAVVAGVAAFGAVLLRPATVVPGLLLAFPLLVVGLLLVGRGTLRSTTARMLSGVSVLFVAGVLATQYAKGGGGEWGGRYFALIIPVGVPVVLLALKDQRYRLSAGAAKVAVIALVVCSVALSVMGLTALRSSHRNTAALVAAVARAGDSVDADMPVMVTTEGAMPRVAWPTFDRQRWLLAQPNGLEDLLGRLRAEGITEVGFVTRNLDRDRAGLDGAGVEVVSVDRSQSARRWHILVLRIV